MKQKIDSSNFQKEKSLKKSQETEIILSFPEKISIELVQAGELRQYELFLWLVALIAPIALGLMTAYFTENNILFLWTAVIFFLLAGLFLVIAMAYRKKVFNGSIQKSARISGFD